MSVATDSSKAIPNKDSSVSVSKCQQDLDVSQVFTGDCRHSFVNDMNSKNIPTDTDTTDSSPEVLDIQGIEPLTVPKNQLPTTDTSTSRSLNSEGKMQKGPMAVESSAPMASPCDPNSGDVSYGQLTVTDSRLEIDNTEIGPTGVIEDNTKLLRHDVQSFSEHSMSSSIDKKSIDWRRDQGPELL